LRWSPIPTAPAVHFDSDKAAVCHFVSRFKSSKSAKNQDVNRIQSKQ